MAKLIEKPITAEIINYGGTQSVRLPAHFQFDGKEVLVSRIGNRVILEPIAKPVFDVEEWWQKMISYNDIDFPSIEDTINVSLDEEISFERE